MRNVEDLARPPFAIVPDIDAQQVGREIVACFDRLCARRDRVLAAYSLAMTSIGVAQTAPLRRAGAAIAGDVDGGVGAGVEDGYHNGRHFLEVALSAHYLARISQLSAERSVRVVTAALIHDFHHDGSKSGDSPFRLEELSASRAMPYLRDAGVDPVMCEQLHALVLATEPHAGVPYARACLDRHAGRPNSAPGPDVPELLARHLRDPQLALEAVLLAEADVLPSIGFTVAHGQKVQDWLAAEWGTQLDAADKLAFIERVSPAIELAAFFMPNIEMLAQAFRRQIDAKE